MLGAVRVGDRVRDIRDGSEWVVVELQELQLRKRGRFLSGALLAKVYGSSWRRWVPFKHLVVVGR